MSLLTARPQATAVVSGTLTSAQVKTLFSAPTTIVPAPGANRAIVTYYGVLVLRDGGIAYADGGNPSAGPLSNPLNGFLTWVAAAFWRNGGSWVSVASGNSTDDASQLANQPLAIGCETADFTAGNGTVGYTIAYQIVSLT